MDSITARPGPETFTSVNPTTEKRLATFVTLTGAQSEQKLKSAAEAFSTYRRSSMSQRKELLLKAAAVLEQQAARWAGLITSEMGKLLKTAEQEVFRSAELCRYYALQGDKFLADEPIATGAKCSYVRYEPLGPILALTPWNYPFYLVFRSAAAALMAGNVCLVKPAPNVPQCARAVEEIFLEAGFPEGVFQTLFVTTPDIRHVLDDPRVKAATVTGGTTAGRHVATLAAAKLKKVGLELGGSDPFIVLPSADVNAAVEAGVQARMISNGQSCIAAKRFIVAESIADDFQAAFASRLKAIRVGDPMLPETGLGPLATSAGIALLERQVENLRSAGARILIGGHRLQRCGYFYEATLIGEIPVESPVCTEEIFGPVALLFRSRDLDHAIEIANSTPYGLGASVWTRDENEYERCIDGLQAGMVFVNNRVTSHPELPFGGIKDSGYGRELGRHGIREYTTLKSVWIE